MRQTQSQKYGCSHLLTLPSGLLAKPCNMPSFSEGPAVHQFSVRDKMFSSTFGVKTAIPANTFLRCGYILKTSSVTTPKFEPAPRIPQKRSAFSESFAVRMEPSAVTTVP